MNVKTKLHLLAVLKSRRNVRSAAAGFTLVELMIVVAVVGILSAVALPGYLQSRNAASAGARIGESIGLARECATFVAAGGMGVAPATGGSTTITCTSGGGTIATTFTAGPVGIRCLADSSIVLSKTTTITVASTDSLSCAFS